MVALNAAAQTASTAPRPPGQFFTTSDGVQIHYVTIGDKGRWVVLTDPVSMS
jgi:hypothetical protein